MEGAATDRTLEQQLAGVETLWEIACALLMQWRAALPEEPAKHAVGYAYERWVDLEEAARQHFRRRSRVECDAADVTFLLRMTDDGRDADAVHAMAWGMSLVTGHTFAPAWRKQLAVGTHALTEGEPYPVADPEWDVGERKLTARPSSLSPAEPGELPTIRVHDGSFDAVVDFANERTLEALAARLEHVVTCHPNVEWSELAFPQDGQRVFPVSPSAPPAQQKLLLELLERALARKPQAIVLPELSVTESIANALGERMAAVDEPCLLVAGSFHRVHEDLAENRAVGFVSGATHRMEHRKSVAFTDDLRDDGCKATKEGIVQVQRLAITVHQADRFRVAIVICKELLTRRVRSCLDRLGVNLLFVPALSLKTNEFKNAASDRVAGAQAFTIVANGPLHGPRGRPLQPAIVVGQPVDPSAVGVCVDTDEPAVKSLHLPL